jgi:hypothetical protein
MTADARKALRLWGVLFWFGGTIGGMHWLFPANGNYPIPMDQFVTVMATIGLAGLAIAVAGVVTMALWTTWKAIR